jgi:hypothetical protein
VIIFNWIFSGKIKWINGKTIEDIAPEVFLAINPEIKARRIVSQDLNAGKWIEDIKRPISINNFLQVLNIWEACSIIHLNPKEYDKWTWLWEADGVFSTKSVYKSHYKTKINRDLDTAVWGTWAPLRCKLAMRLFIRKRIWTADRLATRGLPHNEKCVFCNNAEEIMPNTFL